MRHRTPAVRPHLPRDGYSAGYYSYLWSDTLTADAFEAFTEAGGPYDKAVAERLRKNVFSVGNTVDPADAYRAFRGRGPGHRRADAQARVPGPAGAASGDAQHPGPVRRQRATAQSVGSGRGTHARASRE